MAALGMVEFATASPFHRLMKLLAIAWQLNSSNLAGQVTFAQSGCCEASHAGLLGTHPRERCRKGVLP